ncbi:MAG: GAF domain-containing protein [Firmicutes bacterium]|nr:GAF domain-containing protein [Bacillota bacterium]
MSKYKLYKFLMWFVLISDFMMSVIYAYYMIGWGIQIISLLLFMKILLVFLPLGIIIVNGKLVENYFSDVLEQLSNAIKNINTDGIDERAKKRELKDVIESIDELKASIEEKDHIYEIMNKILVSTVTNMELENFFKNVMSDIMELVESNWAVFYSVNKITNRLEITDSVGFGNSLYSQFDISIEEGSLGQAVTKNEIKILKDLPDDSIFVTKSFLGKVVPKNVMVVPIDDDNDVLGVMALASVYDYTDTHIEIMKKISKYIAYAINNGNYYNKNIRLANELKFQNQLIQNLNEDLEIKIKERTALLDNIINGVMGAAIISIDKNKRIKIINEEAIRLFDINDAVGKNVNFIFSNRNDEFEKKINKGLDILAEKERITDSCDYTAKDGEKYKFDMEMFCMYNVDGQPDGITAVIRTKKMEEV